MNLFVLLLNNTRIIRKTLYELLLPKNPIVLRRFSILKLVYNRSMSQHHSQDEDSYGQILALLTSFDQESQNTL
jgi:hypothetical protein